MQGVVKLSSPLPNVEDAKSLPGLEEKLGKLIEQFIQNYYGCR